MVEPNSFSPSVHYLNKQMRIIHVTIDYEDNNFVSLVFFDSKSYYEIEEPYGRIKVERETFECAMFVNNRTGIEDCTTIYIVFFSSLERDKPCKLVKITRDENDKDYD